LSAKVPPVGPGVCPESSESSKEENDNRDREDGSCGDRLPNERYDEDKNEYPTHVKLVLDRYAGTKKSALAAVGTARAGGEKEAVI
jgi:hypothetical protein